METDDHVNDERVGPAADWLLANWRTAPRPLLATIRQQFGLEVADSIAAIRQANLRMRRVE